ncbi:MAG: hypothetical protein NT154_13715 [Verrucomicrobia bacterium]|nr:hypothetical protein [Verrucomicrobiota bacterium]
MSSTIPKYCVTLAKNTYHNGHPDLVPAGEFPNNSCKHGLHGIEIKASRYPRGWQGHNADESWLMVFVFDSNTPRNDSETNAPEEPRPFRFIKVVGAQLVEADWQFSGRSAKSKRTITASVKRSGFDKMERNWIYRAGRGEALELCAEPAPPVRALGT